MDIVSLKQRCKNIKDNTYIKIYANCGLQTIKLCDVTYTNIPEIFKFAEIKSFEFEKDGDIIKVQY